jgi:hypothetical protein
MQASVVQPTANNPAICDNILDTVGRTPVVRINRLAPNGVTLYVKLEAFNPMASVKDRLALAVIEGKFEEVGAARKGLEGRRLERKGAAKTVLTLNEMLRKVES